MADLSGHKRCPKCDSTRPLSAFNRNASNKDGMADWCRDCTNAQLRQRYHADASAKERQRAYRSLDHVKAKRQRPEAAAAQSAARRTEEYRAKARALRLASPEKYLGHARKWREGNREKVREYEKTKRVLSPEKTQARRAVRVAILSGAVTRQPCVVCGCAKSHAHHADYSRPLDVTWLCSRHHADEHRRMRNDDQSALASLEIGNG